MLKKMLAVALICAAELLILLALRPGTPQATDAPALNALIHAAEAAGGDYRTVPAEDYDFTILSPAGHVLYASAPDLPKEPLAAAAAGRIVLPLGEDMIIIERRQGRDEIRMQQYFSVAVFSVVISAAVMLLCIFWLERRIVRPFRNLQGTAEEIAAGNLGFSLAMDRGGIFGPFTESFDLMRSELAAAQTAAARAAADKQDLIARLSHDLRTPVASIQAVSEIGALTSEPAARRRFEQIAAKTMQLNVLVSNLLNASLEEQTELQVTLRKMPEAEICSLLDGADYQNWMEAAGLPSCAVAADPVRLQQIFDNIFANAYKYGAAPVKAQGFLQDGELLLEIEDAGGGVAGDETASLHLRCYRGTNAGEAPGAGLGLYICDQLLRAMGGELLIRNGQHGLLVTVALPLARALPAAGEDA